MRSSCSRRQISPFISKLLTILDDKEAQLSIIRQESCNGFQIINCQLFCQKVLPKYFRHRNLTSFIRQLNMYGFTKLRKDGDHAYSHKNFIADNKASLKKIQRNYESSQIVLYDKNQSNMEQFDQQFGLLQQQQNILEQKCLKLWQENEKLLQKNQNLTSMIKVQERQKEDFHKKIFMYLQIQSMAKRHQAAQPPQIRQEQIFQKKGQIHQFEESNSSDYIVISDFLDFPELSKDKEIKFTNL